MKTGMSKKRIWFIVCVMFVTREKISVRSAGMVDFAAYLRYFPF